MFGTQVVVVGEKLVMRLLGPGRGRGGPSIARILSVPRVAGGCCMSFSPDHVLALLRALADFSASPRLS